MAKGAISGDSMGLHFNTERAMRDLARKTKMLRKFKRAKKNKIETINVNVAKSGVLAMRRRVRDYHKTIVVAGRKSPSGGPIEIQPGTLRRSIMVIHPKGGATNKWMGVHSSQLSGRKAYSRNDGWFGHIVQGGDQYFGAGVNKGFWSNNVETVKKIMLDRLLREYAALMGKTVDEIKNA